MTSHNKSSMSFPDASEFTCLLGIAQEKCPSNNGTCRLCKSVLTLLARMSSAGRFTGEGWFGGTGWLFTGGGSFGGTEGF